MSGAAPTAVRRQLGRELGIAVALCLAGAVLGLVAAGQPWAHVTVRQPPPLSLLTVALSGRVLAPPVGAAALVGLAGVVAVAAARGWGRVALGGLLVLTGAAMLASLPAVSGARVRDSAALAERVPNAAAAGSAVTVTSTAWPVVAAVGGALVFAAGALTVFRGRRWPAMSARYDAPSGAAASRTSGSAAVAGEAAQWDAIDRGEDPTT